MGVKAVREMAAENGLSYQFVSIDILNKQEEDAAAAEGRKKPDEIDFFWPFATFDSNIDVVHTTYDGVLSTHGVR